MTDGEQKIPYEPTTKRRFELSHDEFSRERVRALLKAHRQLKEEIPFYAGMTLFGSLSKGKELTEDTATFTDLDIFAFLDRESFKETIKEFEHNDQFKEYFEKVYMKHPMHSASDMNRVRDSNIETAAEYFIKHRIQSIIEAETKKSVPEKLVKVETEFISLNDETGQSIFGAVIFHDEWMRDFGYFKDAELANFQSIAAPFFYDIGNGLRKYREDYMRKLLSPPLDEANKHWKLSVDAMKTWE
ncbi:MAG: hypothetical protein AAB966_04120, partial [Patescibacteria group bacterium]